MECLILDTTSRFVPFHLTWSKMMYPVPSVNVIGNITVPPGLPKVVACEYIYAVDRHSSEAITFFTANMFHFTLTYHGDNCVAPGGIRNFKAEHTETLDWFD